MTELPHALAGGLRRPDPAAGVIETLAVDRREPVALDLHLARLGASAAEVLDVALPSTLRDELLDAAATAPPGRHRLRIDVTAQSTTFALAPAAPPSLEPVTLTPVLLPGGLGAHKWRDRALVDALCARHGPFPLFVDADGAVLETGTANVFVVENGELVTPPVDGRLLPGVTRARILAATPAREEPIDLARLAAADAVLLTSSIALVRVAATADGGAEPAERLLALLDGLTPRA
jgi:para-aminobenzoate synthetase/4-amino-4-deoxychorismate lyase